MKDKRPVNLDIGTIRFPLAALASITHRISGVIVFVGIAGLLCLLDVSLSGEEGFAQLADVLSVAWVRFIFWLVLSALAFHMVAGVKHLLLDLGIGESRSAGPLGAKLVVIVSAVLIVLLGVSLW